MRCFWLLAAFLLAQPACDRLPRGCRSTSQADLVARGDELLGSGRTLEAIAMYDEALAQGASPASERGLGLALANLRRWDEAHAKLATYVVAHPDDAPARLAFITASIGRGELARARTEIESLADQRPDLLTPQLMSAALAPDAAGAQRALARLARWEKQSAAKGDSAALPPAELLFARGALLAARGDATAAAQAYERAAQATLRNLQEAGWLAEAYLRTGQPAIAERLLLQVTATAPKLSAAQRLLAEVALDLEQPDRALAALDAVAGEPLPIDRLLRARAELARGENAAAIARLRALVPELERDRHAGLAARARMTLARALIAGAELDAAREALAGVKHPGSLIEARMTTAELELAHERPEQAIAVLQALVTQKPEPPGARLLLAAAHLKRNAAPDAERVMREYLQVHGDDPRGHHMLGTALEAAGQADGARAEYERALVLAPGSTAPLSRLVALADTSGDAARAEQLIRTQLAAAPRVGALHRMLGERLERRGDIAGAEAAYKVSVDADGQRDAAWLAFGEFHGRTGRPARALELFEYVLRRAPANVEALTRAAQIEARVGDAQRAAERYEKALALRPGDVAIQNNLALLLAEVPSQHARALQLAEAAYAAARTSPHVADTLGWVHFKRGEHAAALPLLEAAAAKLGDDAEIHYHLGLTLLAAGRTGPGRKAVERGLALDPAHRLAAEARRSLAQER